MERYLGALELEVGRASLLTDREHALRTIFVGGGTPSFLSPSDLGRFFAILRTGFDHSAVAEFSLEANPEDLDDERVAVLVKSGVTRVSIGAQSFDPRSLRMLGRRHRAADIRGAVERLRHAGVRSVGLDLIVSIPGQTREGALIDLDHALAVAPDHISVYCLTYEPGTGITGALERGRLTPHPPEEELLRMHLARDRIEGRGLRRYEVSNYARPGHRCQHNLTYWRNRDHLGIGPGAVAFVDGVRRKNHPDLKTWCERLEAGLDPAQESERLEPAHSLRETVMVGIRTRGGVSDRWLRARHGVGLATLDGRALARLREEGLIDPDPLRIRLTARGFEVADAVAAELF